MKVVLGVGLAVLAVAVGGTLSRSPLTVIGTNSVPAQPVGDIAGSSNGCQAVKAVPRGTTAIRVSLSAGVGPSVSLQVRSGSTVVTQGAVPAGWGVAESVTVPVRRVSETLEPALICTTIRRGAESVQINGALATEDAPNGAKSKVAQLRIEYMRPGSTTWWGLIPSVARHMGLGRAASGTWIVFLALALTIAVALLASRLTLRELAGAGHRPREATVGAPAGRSTPIRRIAVSLRRVPHAARICALVACLNAACWSIVTPPFQAPDEPSHFAYTQQLAENHRLPVSNEYDFSPEETTALGDLHQLEVHWHPEIHTIATALEQRKLQHDLARRLSRRGGGGAGGAGSGPPLYYLLQTIPYELGSPGTLLDQLALMRLLSALMGGITALSVFLFVREALPRVPWAWTVGGLGVSLAPLLGFMSGAVNPDAMLSAVSATIFYCLARAFRRGLTRRLAIGIGALTAVGFLTKLNFIGLAPGVVLGLIVLTIRARRIHGGGAVLSLALSLALAASPVLVYGLVNLISNRPALGAAAHTEIVSADVVHQISYVWQLYLPRLPAMPSYFDGLSTWRQLWFDKSVGFYGWLDTSFSVRVEDLALLPAGLIALLCIRALLTGRATLRRRGVELAVYVVIAAGLMALIGVTSYAKRSAGGLGLAEPRYLLPTLALVGAGLALAGRGAGRRWGPAVGALIVVLLLAHNVFSQLLVVARYYG